MDLRLKIALEAAQKAGEIIKRNFRTRLKVSTKRNPRDLVSNVDKEAEQAIIKIIKKNFPYDSLLAEESQKDSLDSENLWLIDPLDGTNNYVAGLPIFCTSIAYAFRGEVKIGVIYQPITNEIYTAIKDRKAYLEEGKGKRKLIAVSKVKKLINSLVAYDYSSVDLYRRRIQEVTKRLPGKVRGMRILGSAALEFAWVGGGFADAYISRGAHPWDVAAGALIVEEAGGKVTDWQGNPWKLNDRNYLVSNGMIHEEILSVINSTK